MSLANTFQRGIKLLNKSFSSAIEHKTKLKKDLVVYQIPELYRKCNENQQKSRWLQNDIDQMRSKLKYLETRLSAIEKRSQTPKITGEQPFRPSIKRPGLEL